ATHTESNLQAPNHAGLQSSPASNWGSQVPCNMAPDHAQKLPRSQGLTRPRLQSSPTFASARHSKWASLSSKTTTQAAPSSQSGPASRSHSSPGSAVKTSSMARQVPAIPSSSSCPRQNRVPSQTGATPPSQSSPSAAGATQRPVSLEHTRPSLQRSSSVHSPPAPSLSLHLPGQLSSNTQMRSPSHSISAVQSPPSSTE